MATDQSAPRTGIIAAFMLLTIGALFGVQIALTNFYAKTMAEAKRRVVSAPREIRNLRARDERVLSGGGEGKNAWMNIDRAKELVAMHPRTALSDITPGPSTDVDPLKGWMKMPKKLSAEKNVLEFKAPQPATSAVEGAAGKR